MIELWFLVNSFATTSRGQVQLEVSKHALSSRGKVVWNQKEKWLCACIQISCKIMSSFAGNENCLIALATSFFKSEAILLQSRLDIFDPVHKNGTLRSSPNSLLVVLGNCHETVFPTFSTSIHFSQSFSVKIRPTKIRIEWFVFKIRNTVSNIFLFQKYTF